MATCLIRIWLIFWDRCLETLHEIDDRNHLFNHYIIDHPQDRAQITSRETFLQERVVPPSLVVINPAARAITEIRSNRRFSPSIQEWDGFRSAVEGFQPREAAAPLVHGLCSVFKWSLEHVGELRDESREQFYHEQTVLSRLRAAGLLHYSEAQQQMIHGRPDFVLSSEEGGIVRALLEYKSTHNLTLPMEAAEVVERYNNGLARRSGNDYDRVTLKCGQLIEYMVLNECSFGVLLSATRCYFCCINETGVRVSDAWFVGERHYLRAWAYFYDQSVNQNGAFPAVAARNWLNEETVAQNHKGPQRQQPPRSAKSKSKYSAGGSDTPSKSTKATSGNSRSHNTHHRDSDVPFSQIDVIPFKSVTFLEALGYGLNGCVFRALWKGKEVAVKQFDLGKGGGMEGFLKEIEAYELLRDVQGILIPKALFLTESYGRGIKYLGLQLGRDPTSEDDTSSWGEVLGTLRSQYGFIHDDADRKSGLFIPNGRGGEKLVAIDLEMHTLTEQGQEDLARIKASTMI